MYYEVVFEDGSYSLADYPDDETALATVQTAHDRATAGEPALLDAPEGPKAVRVVKLIKYQQHPGQLGESQALPEEQVNAELPALVTAATDAGVTDLRVLAAEIRDLSNPIADTGPHDSNYKAEGEDIPLPWTE